MEVPKLGQLVTEPDVGRDAVHIAVVPAVNVTRRDLRPGERMANGVVDCFLKEPVRPGERYWLMLYPQTVTSLRHVWSHPAFPDEPDPAPKHRSEADVWADAQEATA